LDSEPSMSLGVFLGASHRIRAHEVTQCDKAFATEINCCKG